MLAVQVSFNDLQEKIRHNLASEQLAAEQNRIAREELGVHQGQLLVSQGELVVHQGTLAENVRSNKAREAETQRHNTVTELQTNIQLDQNERDLNEKIRHNKVSENISWETLEESKRHNIESENLGWSSLNETIRHNQASENIGWYEAESGRIQAYASQAQAAAAQRNAEASMKQAEAAVSNAATNKRKQQFEELKYDTTGRKREESETQLNKMRRTESAASGTLKTAQTTQSQVQTYTTMLNPLNTVLSFLGGVIK